MQERDKFEGYVKSKNWSSAYEWLHSEICLLHSRLIRQRVFYNTFGVLMSFVLAFFTWVVLAPSASDKELEAFPLITLCTNLFNTLTESVSGGKAAVIAGLLLIPLLAGLVALLFACGYKSRKYGRQIGSPKSNRDYTDVQNKLELLNKVHNKYRSGLYPLVYYFLFTGIFTGGVMVITSVPFGLNPFEYLFVAILCDAIYGVIFFAFAAIFDWLCGNNKISSYDVYRWDDLVKMAAGTYVYEREEEPVPEVNIYSSDYETEEERIKRIVIETEEALTGKGYGDY